MGRHVLLADPDVGAIGDGLAIITKQGAAFPERRIQIGGCMTVIDGQNNASAKTRADLSHPSESLEIDFSPLALLQADAEAREILLQGRSHRGSFDLGKTLAR